MKAFTDTPADPAKVAWLRTNQVPLRTIDPTDANFEDLRPLKQSIGNSRVVMLGEQSHRDGATFDAKTRLIRFLHEQMGFNVLAFESGLYDCEVGNTMLMQGRPAADALNSSIFGIWAKGEKMVPLFDYLAATTKTAHPLVLTGFDIQFSSDNRQTIASEFLERLMARLAAIDEDLASEDTRTLLAPLALPLCNGSYKPTKDEHDSTRRQLTDLLDKVTAAVSLRSSRDNDFTLRLIRNFVDLEQLYSIILQQNPNSQYWDGSNIRDGHMAENLVWLLEHRYLLLVEVMREVRIRSAAPPPTREEFRSLCDRYDNVEDTVAALEAL
jgi:erythromycin esterase